MGCAGEPLLVNGAAESSRELFVVHAETQSRSAMKGLRRDADAADPGPSSAPAPAAASPATRRSISMGDFRRAPQPGSEPPSTAATAPSSKLVTPSSSMEFEAARRRLLEVEERQRVIREMEARLEELRDVFVRSEQEAVAHGELVARIAGAAQQGELHVAENSQRLKKGLRFKRHRPTIVFSSMLGLRTCLPWPRTNGAGVGDLPRGRGSVKAVTR
uniref:Si:ch211-160f23.7 n=1 Tax=Scleropages formosus TaxID=113540 RepID=A0A8C9TYF5_SCLFO